MRRVMGCEMWGEDYAEPCDAGLPGFTAAVDLFAFTSRGNAAWAADMDAGCIEATGGFPVERFDAR